MLMSLKEGSLCGRGRISHQAACGGADCQPTPCPSGIRHCDRVRDHTAAARCTFERYGAALSHRISQHCAEAAHAPKVADQGF